MPKAYTRGWRDRSTGDMNINVKIGNSYSASSTIMIHPLDKISTLIKSAVDFVAMGDDPLREFRISGSVQIGCDMILQSWVKRKSRYITINMCITCIFICLHCDIIGICSTEV